MSRHDVEAVEPSFAKHILIIKHGAFGDLIQSLGAIQSIRLHFPQANITLLTSPQYASLMARCPFIDGIVTDARQSYWRVLQTFRLYQSLKKLALDCVIDLQNSSRTNWYRKTLLKENVWIARKPTEPVPESGLKGIEALLNRNHICTATMHKPDLSWLADSVSHRLDTLNIKKPYCMLIPGASASHPEKRWPHYPELASLLAKSGIHTVAVLGPDEINLKSDFKTPVLTNLNWFELAGLVQSADYVVGNDTGPCHLASGMRRPGVALFGPATSAARSELSKGAFETLSVDSLSALSAESVAKRVLSHF